MWNKKSPYELARERAAATRQSWLVALAFLLLACGSGFPARGLQLPIAARIVLALAGGILVLGWYQRRRWRRLRMTVWICGKCNVVKTADSNRQCACGGTFAPLATMKWIEPEVDQPAVKTNTYPIGPGLSPVPNPARS